MRKKPSLPLRPPPPLSLQAFSEVRDVEDIIQDALLDCSDNLERIRQSLHVGVAAKLNVQMKFYFSLPKPQIGWFAYLIPRTVDSIIGMCSALAPGDQFRDELLQAASHELAQKLETEAIKNKATRAAPLKPVPVPSEAVSSSQQDSVPLHESVSVERPVNASTNEEIARRSKLLNEYKAATKSPSSKQIYEAGNSRIHKPEFYLWVNGTLPTDSATTANFERFLREKKPPIPKKSKG